MRLRPTLETLVRPYTLLLLGGALSFLAWVIPWGSHVPSAVRGFRKAQPWTWHGALFLLAWYGFFFLVALGGFALGRRIRPFRRAEEVPWESYYVFLTTLAVIGAAYSYTYISIKSPHVIGMALKHQQFNQVRYVLPESAGIQTLRYAVCLTAGIAIFELGRRHFRLLHVLNVVLLLLVSAIAARTLLIIATIVVVGLAARHLQTTRVDPRKLAGVVLVGAVALFAALAVLNYSRNADFYRSNGVTDPALMNVDEMIRYLGIPFQASVAVSNHVGSWPAVPSTVAAGTRQFVVPAYLTSGSSAAVFRADTRYRSIVSIPKTQSTNSVLALMWGVFGVLSFPILGFVVLVAAAISGHASRYRSYAFLAGLVTAYCCAEWWRTWLFNA
ncbi:MAG: hypothetical protein ACRDL7_08100, partial [Gaiellaceae bacterium]